jgi:hypothetical protein
VGQDLLNVEFPSFEIHIRDEAVFVVADIDDELPGAPSDIGGRQRLLEFWEIAPCR